MRSTSHQHSEYEGKAISSIFFLPADRFSFSVFTWLGGFLSISICRFFPLFIICFKGFFIDRSVCFFPQFSTGLEGFLLTTEAGFLFFTKSGFFNRLPLILIHFTRLSHTQQSLHLRRKAIVISGHETYKSRVHMILGINDLTLVNLFLLISLFDQLFFTNILFSYLTLCTESYLPISYYKNRFYLVLSLFFEVPQQLYDIKGYL